jgi:hypothetical protein
MLENRIYAGAGKSTTLHWLTRFAGMSEEFCLQFLYKHSGKSTHTTKLTSALLYATRVFDTPGLPSLDDCAAYGMKWAAAGFWKENCIVTYLQRPTNITEEPLVSPNTRRCMHATPSPRTKAHGVLLLLSFTEDPVMLDEYTALLKNLKEGEFVRWMGGEYYLEGIEPVLAVTHAPCKGGEKAPCAAVDSAAVALFIRRLAYSADGDNAILITPGGPNECLLHGHGRKLCYVPELNYLPPRQYVAVLHALKAKAITHIRAFRDALSKDN